jgi:hypothetical protein
MPDSSSLRRVHEGLTMSPVRLFTDSSKPTSATAAQTATLPQYPTLGGLREDSIRLWERSRELADAVMSLCRGRAGIRERANARIVAR